jgi:NitT/TauT family transport system ATP-binding protein
MLKCEGISHRFGAKRVLHNINLEIKRGQFVSVVGSSGCGKSTLLKAILGTLRPTEGQIVIWSKSQGHKIVSGPSRDCGIVDQQYIVYPFLTTLQNVAYGLMFDQTSIPFRSLHPLSWRKLRKRHYEEAVELLVKIGLEKSIYNYPHELSGGMRQRVAIAQALIMKPKILLLDEPFGALDEATSESLQLLMLKLYGENQEALKRGEEPPYTVMFVTHELAEAIYLGDRVIGMSAHWNFKAKGFKECPGATIVYDEQTPMYDPHNPHDFRAFKAQKEEILKRVYDPSYIKNHEELVTCWQDVRNVKHNGGEGNGNKLPVC